MSKRRRIKIRECEVAYVTSWRGSCFLGFGHPYFQTQSIEFECETFGAFEGRPDITDPFDAPCATPSPKIKAPYRPEANAAYPDVIRHRGKEPGPEVRAEA